MSEQNSDFTRRKFMTASVGCLAAAAMAGVTPSVVRGQEKETEPDKKGIVSRKLGRTDLMVPIVSMGAGAANDPGLVQACFEAGMRHFDTAASYGFGRNEQMVGMALAKMGVRDKAIIGTKVLTPAQRTGVTPAELKKRVIAAIEGSLKRLKTDYIDILCIHDVRDAATVKDEATMEALVHVKKQGKVRYVGTSTHAAMADVINATVEAGIYDTVLTSFNFTMADDAAMMSAVANAGKTGVGVIAMKTQAGGANYPNPETLRQYSNAVVNSAALKWVLRNENVATTIPGIGNYDHMRANMAIAGNLEYTDEEKKFLSDNSIKLSMGFCRQCRSCLASCPHNTEIPDLMRTHMYATQYADFHKARTTIDQIARGRGLDACASCSTCTAQCVNSVDIPRKIGDLKLIYA